MSSLTVFIFTIRFFFTAGNKINCCNDVPVYIGYGPKLLRSYPLKLCQ